MTEALRDVVRDLAASSQGIVGGIFDVSRLDAEGKAMVEHALSSAAFDFSRLRPKLRSVGKVDRVPVTWADLGKKVNAIVTVPRRPTLQMNADLHGVGPEKQAAIFLGETAHLADTYWLSNEQRRAIFKLFGGGSRDQWFNGEPIDGLQGHSHPGGTGHHHAAPDRKSAATKAYYRQIGESFMGGFIFAVSSIEPTPDHILGFKFKPTPEIGAGIKRIIGGAA